MPDHAFEYLIENVESKITYFKHDLYKSTKFCVRSQQKNLYDDLITTVHFLKVKSALLKIKDIISDEQITFDKCLILKKDSTISQKRKYINEEQETISIQTSRREQKLAVIINKALLTIFTKEIQYMLSKSSIS